MKKEFRLIVGCALVQVITTSLALGQVLTHGPVVGGVTASAARVFVRSDQAASVLVRYGTDPTTAFMGDFVNLVLRKKPIIHQWDDHDAGINNIDKTYPNWNLSQQVFEEYVPSYRLPSVTPGIWQNFSYAQADFFVLDCRSQ